MRSKSLLVYLSSNVEFVELDLLAFSPTIGVIDAYSTVGMYFVEAIADMRPQLMRKALLAVSDAVFYCLSYRKERKRIIDKHGLYCLFRSDRFPWTLAFVNMIYMIIAEALYICRNTGGNKAKNTSSDDNDSIEILFAASDIVLDGGLGPKEINVKKYEFDMVTDTIVENIYSYLIASDKNEKNIEIVTRCLVLCAYCLDLYSESGELLSHRASEPGFDSTYKLAQYIPRDPMTKLLEFCKRSETGVLFETWNESTEAVIFGSRARWKDLSTDGL